MAAAWPISGTCGLAEIRARPELTAYVAVQSLAQVAFNAFPILFIVFVVDELGGNGSEVGMIRGTAAFGGHRSLAAGGARRPKVLATTADDVGCT